MTIKVPEPKAWTGQRVPFFVELRARGSFGGATNFSLPDIPRTVIMKVGNATVSSEEVGGESWFVQTHEFALFSQQSGTVEIPGFEVRFGSRDGFTGPVNEQQGQVPAARVEIQRPPDSEDVGFLVTAESIDVTEKWEPQPSPAEVGAIFKRTIQQSAEGMTGMALAAAPTTAPDGIRVYPGQPEVTDKTERGDFLGERRETITYMLQKAGTFELPALTYVWWNPKTEKLLSTTLPAVSFEVAAPPQAATGEETAAKTRSVPTWLIAGAVFVGLGVWQRRRIAHWLTTCWKKLNPPDRVAERKLLRACRQNDAAAAQTAWNEWCNTLDHFPETSSPELRSAVLEMQRHLYGAATDGSWRGDDLATAFNARRAAARINKGPEQADILPPLNP